MEITGLKKFSLPFITLLSMSYQLQSQSYLQDLKDLLPKSKQEILKKITMETKIVGDGIEFLREENKKLKKRSTSIYNFNPEQQKHLEQLTLNYRKNVWNDVNIFSLHLLSEKFPPFYKNKTEEAIDIFQENKITLPETYIFASKRLIITNKNNEPTGNEVAFIYTKLDNINFDYIICIRKNKQSPWIELFDFNDFDSYPLNPKLYPLLNSLEEESIEKNKLLQKINFLSKDLSSLRDIQKKPEFKLLFQRNLIL